MARRTRTCASPLEQTNKRGGLKSSAHWAHNQGLSHSLMENYVSQGSAPSWSVRSKSSQLRARSEKERVTESRQRLGWVELQPNGEHRTRHST
jgi:hypothetical protein